MATAASRVTPPARARPAWRRTTTELARRAASTFMGHQRAADERLDAIERHLASIEDQLLALHEMAETLMDVENQSTELLGRLLRSATDRIEDLEGRVGQAP